VNRKLVLLNAVLLLVVIYGGVQLRNEYKAAKAREAALRAVRKGGRVVCAGIHMSDIPSFPYDLLWQERQLVSVANLTRQDGLDFLKIVPQARIRTQTTAFPLVEANDVLTKLRTGQILGAAVLTP